MFVPNRESNRAPFKQVLRFTAESKLAVPLEVVLEVDVNVAVCWTSPHTLDGTNISQETACSIFMVGAVNISDVSDYELWMS